MSEINFRQAMGKFATGVTVITTVLQDQIYGMTANAFMSVSLDPELVLISVGEKAHMNTYIKQSGKFAVNILSETQKEISMHFAGQMQKKEEVSFKWFAGLPVLDKSLVHAACDVQASYQAGDHTLFLGIVRKLQVGNGKPLTFFEGNYRNIC